MKENYNIGAAGGGMARVRGHAEQRLLPSLQSLQLCMHRNCCLARLPPAGVEGARALGRLLATLPALRELNLSRNHLSPEGARQLASGVRGCQSLAVLNLEACKMKAEGVEHLADALVAHAGLSHLHLARNGAGDKGAKALVAALEANVSLAYLDLRANALGLTAARLLSTLLKERNDSLKGARGCGGILG